MKQMQSLTLRSFFFLCVFTFFSVLVSAQENTGSEGSSSSTSKTTTTKSTDINISANDADAWYTQPWIWIVGAAVFILLLVALLRGSGSKEVVSTSDRVTVKKTVERDRDADI